VDGRGAGLTDDFEGLLGGEQFDQCLAQDDVVAGDHDSHGTHLSIAETVRGHGQLRCCP